MPNLSVILVCYKMADQIGNTMESLRAPYQKEIENDEVEILLVDNGSPEPLDEGIWSGMTNVTYISLPPSEARPSPAQAINRAVSRASAGNLCIMIDGARMVSPGTLHWGLRLLELSALAFVEVRGWHLGPKWQPESIMEGYNHERETQLLKDIRWRENGYRLFDIAADTPQTKLGLSVPAAESNCFFISRELFDRLGGFDERYDAPGGGLVNLDFYARAVAAADQVWTVLGEGTFHQVHGGAATGLAAPDLRQALVRWRRESEEFRGRLPILDKNKFALAGHLPEEFCRWLSRHEAAVTRLPDKVLN
ncbi:MAG: glycosyltransferase [Verrucomicrobiota bacterium]